MYDIKPQFQEIYSQFLRYSQLWKINVGVLRYKVTITRCFCVTISKLWQNLQFLDTSVKTSFSFQISENFLDKRIERIGVLEGKLIRLFTNSRTFFPEGSSDLEFLTRSDCTEWQDQYFHCSSHLALWTTRRHEYQWAV